MERILEAWVEQLSVSYTKKNGKIKASLIMYIALEAC